MGVEERDFPEKEPGSDSENRVENASALGGDVTTGGGGPFESKVEARIMGHFHEVMGGTGMRPRWCHFLLNTVNWGSEMGLALDFLPKCCVTSGKASTLSGPQFSHLNHGRG